MNLLKYILSHSRLGGLLCALVIIGHLPYVTADTNIYYSVKPNRGNINTDFYVQVSISGKDFTNTSQPSFEESEDMSLQYESSSVQQQMINGDVSFQKSFNYKIIFNKVLPTGEHKLPRGAVFIDGKKHRLPTKSIYIENGSPAKDPNASINPNRSQSNNPKVPNNDGFQFVQFVSNDNPFIGEQVLYRVEIIAPDNLQKAELAEFEPQGVWRERYGADEKKIRTTQNLSIHSFSESWFPVQAGELEVPTRILRAEVREFQKRKRPNIGFGSNLSEQFFGNLLPYLNQFKSVEKLIKAPAFKINVKPLPPPPSGLTGFIPVGQIKVTSTLSDESTNIGEPVTLTIQVSGDANLRPLEVKDPGGLNKSELKRYDDKPILSRTIGDSNVTFYKTFKITLIPLKAGYIKIPAFEIQWFDPITEKYEKYSTPIVALRVIGDEASNNTRESTPKITTKPNSYKTIIEPKGDSELVKENQAINKASVFTFYRLTSIYISLIALLVIISQIIFSALKKKITGKKYRDIIRTKKLKAEIKHDLAKNNFDIGIIEKFKTLISIKLDRDVSSMTSEELIDAASNAIPASTLKELKSLIHEIELYRFSEKKGDTSIIAEKTAKIVDSI